MTEWDDPTGARERAAHDPWRAPAPGAYAHDAAPPAYRPLPPPGRDRRRRTSRSGLLAGLVALVVVSGGGAYVATGPGRAVSGAYRGAIAPADTSATHRGSGPPPAPGAARSSAATDPVLSVDQVSAVVTPGVVVITSDLAGQNAEAAGTGMVLTPTGEILTNNHVVAGATRISVTVVNTHAQYSADVVATSPTNDVALLQLRGATGLSTIPLGNSDTVFTGQSVVAIGNAGGRGSLSVVSGTVTSTNQAITATDQNGGNRERLGGMIAAEAQIEAGDSGGPLADRAGRVIGMNTAASTASGRQDGGQNDPTYGFAIPINRALTVAESLRQGAGTGAHGRGYLGIRVSSTPPAGGGALVESVTDGSPAQAAGLAAGDVVTTLDGDPVDSASGLTASLGATSPGQQVMVGWTDSAGRRHLAPVTLGSGPAQ